MALYSKLSAVSGQSPGMGRGLPAVGCRFSAFHHYSYQLVTSGQFAIADGWRLASGG